MMKSIIIIIIQSYSGKVKQQMYNLAALKNHLQGNIIMFQVDINPGVLSKVQNFKSFSWPQRLEVDLYFAQIRDFKSTKQI